MPEERERFCQRSVNFKNTCLIGSYSQSIQGERRFCDTLPSKQADLLVRAPSPAPSIEPSLYWLTRGRFVASKRREGQQAGGFMMRKKVYSDILPQFGVTSCLARRDILPQFGATSCLGARDILPWQGRNILPWQLRDILPRPLSLQACLLARHKP
jgi:hypothetical protein